MNKKMPEREIEFPLAGFTGGATGRETDISQRVLSNRDACLLLLAANGPEVKSGTLIALLRAWRPLEGAPYSGGFLPRRTGNRELYFTYLFNSHYGHITNNYEGVPRKPYYSYARTKESFFWRERRGHIRISAAGYRRLASLIAAMKFEGCVPTSLKSFRIL